MPAAPPLRRQRSCWRLGREGHECGPCSVIVSLIHWRIGSLKKSSQRRRESMMDLSFKPLPSDDKRSVSGGQPKEGSAFQQVPGFAIALVAVAGLGWGEPDIAHQARDEANGQDVPDVLGDNVGGDEIN